MTLIDDDFLTGLSETTHWILPWGLCVTCLALLTVFQRKSFIGKHRSSRIVPNRIIHYHFMGSSNHICRRDGDLPAHCFWLAFLFSPVVTSFNQKPSKFQIEPLYQLRSREEREYVPEQDIFCGEIFCGVHATNFSLSALNTCIMGYLVKNQCYEE